MMRSSAAATHVVSLLRTGRGAVTPALGELLDRLESDPLDFKATGYRWADEDSRNALVRDLVSRSHW